MQKHIYTCIINSTFIAPNEWILLYISHLYEPKLKCSRHSSTSTTAGHGRVIFNVLFQLLRVVHSWFGTALVYTKSVVKENWHHIYASFDEWRHLSMSTKSKYWFSSVCLIGVETYDRNVYNFISTYGHFFCCSFWRVAFERCLKYLKRYICNQTDSHIARTS